LISNDTSRFPFPAGFFSETMWMHSSGQTISHDYEMAGYTREPFVAPLKGLLDGIEPTDYKE
jgi:hypothetical protein